MGPAALSATKRSSLYALSSQCLKVRITGAVSELAISPWGLPVVLSPNHTLKFRVQGTGVILLYPSISPIIGNLSVNATISGTSPVNVITYFVTPFFNITSADTYSSNIAYAAGNMIKAWTCNAFGSITGLSYSIAYKTLPLTGLTVLEKPDNYTSTSTSSSNYAVSFVPNNDLSDHFGNYIKTTDCLYSLHVGYRYTGNTNQFTYTI